MYVNSRKSHEPAREMNVMLKVLVKPCLIVIGRIPIAGCVVDRVVPSRKP